MDNIQIIAKDLNGFTNLCFRNVSNLSLVVFSVFCIFSLFLWLSLTRGDISHWFHYDF